MTLNVHIWMFILLTSKINICYPGVGGGGGGVPVSQRSTTAR